MRAFDSVRDQLVMLLLSMVLLVTVVAATGALGVTSLTEDVDVLVDDLRPAAYSNIALRNDMSRAQSAVLAWELTGDRSQLTRFRGSLEEARIESRRLAQLAAADPELAAAVAQETSAMRAWQAAASERVRRAPRTPRPADVQEAQRSYDRFVDLNDAVSFTLNASIDVRGEHARDRARWVVLVVALASMLGLGVTAFLGIGVIRRVGGPLQSMEFDVARLSSGDVATRVSTSGPREFRGVATALNVLAEENQRARELEGQVISRLTQLDRAKDEFVSTVSHELRTPLTSISGYIELFEDGFADALTSQQQSMLGVVKRNVDRLRTLIEDLLTLSRVESDAFRTSFDLVDLSVLTSDVVGDVEDMAARAEVRVRASGLDRSVLVRGDAGQLSRAMLNLVTNAIKFSPVGGEVWVRLVERDDEVVFSVVDHGIGIPGDELGLLGTRFYRASNAVEAEITGPGLGLRIVRTIAENHGGRLDLDSSEGEGTVALFVVPSAPASPGNKAGGTRLLEG